MFIFFPPFLIPFDMAASIAKSSPNYMQKKGSFFPPYSNYIFNPVSFQDQCRMRHFPPLLYVRHISVKCTKSHSEISQLLIFTSVSECRNGVMLYVCVWLPCFLFYVFFTCIYTYNALTTIPHQASAAENTIFQIHSILASINMKWKKERKFFLFSLRIEKKQVLLASVQFSLKTDMRSLMIFLSF